MKYNTVNEYDHFEFDDVHISDFESHGIIFNIVLDDVKILPENSCNRDIRKMRTNELVFSIENASIVTLIVEGYKIYNADGVLMSEDEDKVLDESSYKEVFDCMPDGYAFSITKEPCDDKFKYTFVLDGTNEKTYTLIVEGTADRQEWDRFMNLE